MDTDQDITNLLQEQDEPCALGNKQIERILMRLH